MPGPREWQCPACDLWLKLAPGSAEGTPHACAVCGNAELYRKKDFPHWLGMGLLAAACAAFVVLNAVYRQWWGWAVLLGSAALDGLLYWWVKDVTVCYRCGAHYRGFPANPEHQPFDQLTGERYRQERLRREQLGAARKTAG